jgi:formate dehydrogenase subunit gamma
MTAAATIRKRIACIAALVLIAFAATIVAEMVSATDVQAQSSVRPPAGAVGSGMPTDGSVPGGVQPGGFDNSDMWRAVRKGIQGTVSIPDKNAALLVQSEGDNWRAVRNGPLVRWGGIALGAIIVVLALFYLVRGKIRIDHGFSGKTVTRFGDIERIGHWLLAVSFIILAITGLNITFGKMVLMPVIGKSAFSSISALGKWLHNYVAFAFMAGLVMIFILWIKENFPNRYDLQWMAKAGGIFTKGVHPPAEKFNAGQKILFWLVILGGISISLSGIAMLFPFQFAMFSKTFAFLNIFGFDLPTDLAPIQEMQLSTLWHAIIALALIVVIIAHIYIGTIGMEGAFDAMGSGEVDENWAKEHHSVWAREDTKAGKKGSRRAKAVPAE